MTVNGGEKGIVLTPAELSLARGTASGPDAGIPPWAPACETIMKQLTELRTLTRGTGPRQKGQ